MSGWEAVRSSRFFTLPYPLDRAFGRRGRRSSPCSFPSEAESLLTRFHDGDQPDRAAYEALFRYFVYGWDRYRSDDYSSAAYYSGGSKHYRLLDQVLSRDPGLRLRRDSARELKSVDSLIEQGFLTVSPAYEAWVKAHACASPPR